VLSVRHESPGHASLHFLPMTWLHSSAPVVGILLLGFLWIFVDGVLRHPELRRHPPIDGVVLGLGLAVAYVTLAGPPPGGVLRAVVLVLFALVVLGSVVAGLAWTRIYVPPFAGWRRRGLLFHLPELITPVAGVRALWRRSAPLRWGLRHPRGYLAFRRLGYRRLAVAAELSRWFTPAQLGRLGWDPEAVAPATYAMARVDATGWDAEAFLRASRGHHVAHRITSWAELSRLGVDDPAEFQRYMAAPDADLDLALRFGAGPVRVPYGIVTALRRSGVRRPWPVLYALRNEYRRHGDRYPGGWPSILAWIEHSGPDPDGNLEAWRAWTVVSQRAPRLEPAWWAAAGFTVDEALAVLDTGAEPDAEVLLALAALRRSG
jgi:hypothetical protein